MTNNIIVKQEIKSIEQNIFFYDAHVISTVNLNIIQDMSTILRVSRTQNIFMNLYEIILAINLASNY